MKKLVYLFFLVLILVSLLFTGCGIALTTAGTTTGTAKTTTSPVTTGTSLNKSADTFPIVSTPTTLKVLALGARPEVENWDTNEVTKYWENKTGVHLQWEVITDGAASKQKIGVIMSSGDLPDIILSGSTVTLDQAVAYGSQKLILSLNDMIDQYGVNTKKMFAFDTALENSMTAPDGNIYFLPLYASTELTHTGCMQKCMINTKWLSNLNLKIPTTTDEFYEVLKAFKNNDANKNGITGDEIPLVAQVSYFDTFLMNSFQYNSGTSGNRLMLEKGSIIACYTQPGWKTGLKYLRKLYAEGLADKEIFLTNSDQLKMYTGDAKGNRVGANLTYAYSSFINLTTDVVNEFAFIDPLKGPDGLQQTPYTRYTLYPTFFITKNCKIPEIAFRWGDAKLVDPFADSSLKSLEGFYGPEGQGWAKTTAGEKGLDGTTPAKYKWLFTWGKANNLNWHEYGPRFARSEWKLWMSADLSTFNQEALLYQATVKQYKPYAQEKNVPSTLLFEPSKVAEVGQLKETINTYVGESISKFVTGALDLDKNWDSYLSELDKIGLKKLLSLYQEAYDRQYK